MKQLIGRVKNLVSDAFEPTGDQTSSLLPAIRIMAFLAGAVSLFLGMSRLYELEHTPERPNWLFFVGVFLFVVFLDVGLGWLQKRRGHKLSYPLHLAGFAVLASLWVLSTRTTVYLIDDSFYYLEVAHNIVHRHWSTFDEIVTTNGYHPLWMFCLVTIEYLSSIFHLHDPMLFIRLTYAVQIGILASSVYVIYLHLIRVLPSVPAMLFAFGYLAFPYTRLNALNGMESGLLVLLLLWSHYLLTASSGARPGKGLPYILLILITLTRIEVGILWSVVYIGYALLWKRNRKEILAISISAAIGIAVSVGYNYAVAGMPMSYAGELKREWANQNISSFLQLLPLQQIFMMFQAALTVTVFEYPAWVLKRPLEFFFVAHGYGLSAARVSLGIVWVASALVALLLVFGGVAWQWKRCKAILAQTQLWLFVVFAFILTGIYKVLLFAPAYVLGGGRSDFQGWWYHHPFNTAIYFLAISIPIGIYLSTPLKRRILKLVLLAIPIALIVTQVGEASVLYHNASLYYSDFYDAVNQALLRGEPIKCVWGGGGRDAFALTYQGVTVINTDGLVNSPEYIERIRADGEIAPYLRAHRCGYFMAPYDDPTGTGVVRDKESAVLVQRGRYLFGKSTYSQYSSNAIWKLAR